MRMNEHRDEGLRLDGVAFHPWIGASYWATRERTLRLLIAGESHYDEGYARPPRYTQDVIQSNIEARGKRHAFWTKTARVVSSDPSRYSTLDDRRLFWDAVSFYNYVQMFLPRPRVPPEPRMWAVSHEPFQRVLQALKPHCILVLGDRLWINMWPGAGVGPLLNSRIVGAEGARTRLYPVGTGVHALASWIQHPSTGFKYAKWRPRVQALLEAATGFAGSSAEPRGVGAASRAERR